MHIKIQHETSSRLRVSAAKSRFSDTEEEKIHYVLDQIDGTDEVEVYNATAGIAVKFHADRDKILDALKSLNFDEVNLPADYIDTHDVVRMKEIQRRHLGPKVKAKMRARILAEMAFDIVAPMPLQVGYHVYQLITLRGI